MDSNNRKIHEMIAESHTEALKSIKAYQNDVTRIWDGTFAELNSRLLAYEKNCAKQLHGKDELAGFVSEATKKMHQDLVGPISEVKNVVSELKNETKQLRKIMSELSKKVDMMRSPPSMPAHNERHFAAMHPYPQMSPLSYDPGAWRGHNLPISVNNARYMEPDTFKRYCAEAGLNVGGEPDVSRLQNQHPLYHGPRPDMHGFPVEVNMSPSRQTQFPGSASQLSGQQ